MPFSLIILFSIWNLPFDFRKPSPGRGKYIMQAADTTFRIKQTDLHAIQKRHSAGIKLNR